MKSERIKINFPTLSLEKDEKNIPKLLLDAKVLQFLLEKKIELHMHVSDSGPNTSGKTVILLHGWGLSGKVFTEPKSDSIALDYLNRGFRVVVMDFLGHGESDSLSKLEGLDQKEKIALASYLYNFHSFAAMIRQILEGKKIKFADWVVWSIATPIAVKAVANAPDLMRSFVSIAAPPVHFSSGGMYEGYVQGFSQRDLSPDLNVATAMHNGILFEEKYAYFWDELKKCDPLTWCLDPARHPERDRYTVDLKTRALTTKTPYLMMVPMNDCSIHRDYMLSFQGRFKNPISKVQPVPGGHAFFVVNREGFCKMANEFYRAIDAAPSPRLFSSSASSVAATATATRVRRSRL